MNALCVMCASTMWTSKRQGKQLIDTWNKRARAPCSWQVKGNELLEAPIVPCFVRAPTDNDIGGSGGTAHAARWLQLGLDKLDITAATVKLCGQSASSVMVQVCCKTMK
jgi:hypothetical protein